jgi:hypothetical protein
MLVSTVENTASKRIPFSSKAIFNLLFRIESPGFSKPEASKQPTARRKNRPNRLAVEHGLYFPATVDPRLAHSTEDKNRDSTWWHILGRVPCGGRVQRRLPHSHIGIPNKNTGIWACVLPQTQRRHSKSPRLSIPPLAVVALSRFCALLLVA